MQILITILLIGGLVVLVLGGSLLHAAKRGDEHFPEPMSGRKEAELRDGMKMNLDKCIRDAKAKEGK